MFIRLKFFIFRFSIQLLWKKFPSGLTGILNNTCQWIVLKRHFLIPFFRFRELGSAPFFSAFLSIVRRANKNGSFAFVDITTPCSCLGLNKAKSQPWVYSNCHFRTTINFSGVAFEVSSPKCLPCFFSVSFITHPQKSSPINDWNSHLYIVFFYLHTRIFMNFVVYPHCQGAMACIRLLLIVVCKN